MSYVTKGAGVACADPRPGPTLGVDPPERPMPDHGWMQTARVVGWLGLAAHLALGIW